MNFSKKIFIGEQIENKRHTLNSIKKGKYINKVFFLCVDVNSVELFDIVDSSQITKPYFESKNYTVVAVCKNKEETKLVLKKIIELHIKKGENIYSLKESFIV